MDFIDCIPAPSPTAAPPAIGITGCLDNIKTILNYGLLCVGKGAVESNRKGGGVRLAVADGIAEGKVAVGNGVSVAVGIGVKVGGSTVSVGTGTGVNVSVGTGSGVSVAVGSSVASVGWNKLSVLVGVRVGIGVPWGVRVGTLGTYNFCPA